MDCWEPYYRKAVDVGLAFTISIAPGQDPGSAIWRQMNSGIQAALDRGQLVLPKQETSSWSSSEVTFGGLPWMLIRSSVKGATHSLGMKRETALVQGVSVTLPNLLKATKQRNPLEEQGGGPVVFIGKYPNLFSLSLYVLILEST